MTKPKVSVLLPVYNGQEYLEESIDSVLTQNYKDFEFLICDDGSTDNSIKIIDSKQRRRIRFFQNDINHGLFKTLNILIAKSKGSYLRLWSQDDIMKPYCLEEEVLFLERYPFLGFCYCARDTINRRGKVIQNAPFDKTPEIISPVLAGQIMFYHGSITGNISTVMLRKKVLKDLGLFCQDMRLAADFEMWVRITDKYPIGFISKPLINLRCHKNQLSREKRAAVIFIQEQKDIFAKLTQRLPAQILDSAKWFKFKKNAILDTRYLISYLLKGRFRPAIELAIINSRRYNIIYAFFIWLLTLNGKFFKQKPIFFIKEK